jgi:hypothetical protein
MPEHQEICEIQLVIGDDSELRMPSGRAIGSDWEMLPWGGQVCLTRTERGQYALGGGVESWTLILRNSPSDLHHQDMGYFETGQIYIVSPQGIQKLESVK